MERKVEQDSTFLPCLQWVTSGSPVGRRWVAGSWNEVFLLQTVMSAVVRWWVGGGSTTLESYMETSLNKGNVARLVIP